MKAKCVGLGFLLLFVISCSSVGVTTIKKAEPKPKDCTLDIYTSESEIKKPFETICLLDAKTSTAAFSDRTMAGAIEILKPNACLCGADAILIINGRSEGANFWTNGQGYATVKGLRYTAK